MSLTLAEFLRRRALHARNDCLRAIRDITSEQALSGAHANWPPHGWGIGQDGSIAGILYHLAAWKQMTLPILLGEPAVPVSEFDQAAHPPRHDWNRIRRWYKGVSQSWLDALDSVADHALNRVCNLEGHVIPLATLIAEIYEHDAQHTSQIDYLMQLDAARRGESATESSIDPV